VIAKCKIELVCNLGLGETVKTGIAPHKKTPQEHASNRSTQSQVKVFGNSSSHETYLDGWGS
jgi:hypothetical protein